MSIEVRAAATVDRINPELPRFVVFAQSLFTGWELKSTGTVETCCNGRPLGRRSLVRWPEREAWFLTITEARCRNLGIDTGDSAEFTLRPADTRLPQELELLLNTHPGARTRWERLTAAQQRMIREEVLAAKHSSTRVRRARKSLGLPPEAG